MNYSTLKTAAVCLMVSAFGLTEVAKAQEPVVFGGRKQYRTWSIGINGGVTMPTTILGNEGPLNNKVNYIDKFKFREYYGLTVRKQFSNWFGLELAGNRGRIFAYNETPNPDADYGFESAESEVDYAVSLNAVFQLATIDFLRRENAVNFYASVGGGYYELQATQYANNDGTSPLAEQQPDSRSNPKRDCETFIPVGLGVKFKLSDRVALNLGHTINFMNTREMLGAYSPNNSTYPKDRFSYTYAGLEFSLGSSDKADLTWHNPVASMYDELKDESLRNELEALKQRVSTLEGTVDVLNRDTDGDGVSDRFDKCPGTPAGTQVDGSGCPIKFPEPVVVQEDVASYSPIQFEFDSSVLKTESYSILDKLSAELRRTGNNVTLEGHASAEGTEAYNRTLSVDRANAVKTYLVNSGVPAAKINTEGYGEDRPIASNTTEEGRVINRRVEIKR